MISSLSVAVGGVHVASEPPTGENMDCDEGQPWIMGGSVSVTVEYKKVNRREKNVKLSLETI